MKNPLIFCLILCLLVPVAGLSTGGAKITVFDPQSLEEIALPIDADNPIDTTTLEGVDVLLDVVRGILAVVLPEGTPFAVEPNRTMLRRRDSILEVSGSYRMVAADPGSPSASYHVDILHDGPIYRPLNLYLENELIWESENQPVNIEVSSEVFHGLLYPMKRGQQLDDVKRLQQALKELGFFRGDVVITFGEETQIAVRQFQKMNGLQNTGMADESTLALLYGSDPVLNSEGEEMQVSQEALYVEYRPLRFGVEGTVVRRLQQALADQGLYESDLAMRFGANTENAVRAFQKAKGLPETGVADHITQTLLYTGQLPADAQLPEETSLPVETNAPEASTLPQGTYIPEGPDATDVPTPTPAPAGTNQPVNLNDVPNLEQMPDTIRYPNG